MSKIMLHDIVNRIGYDYGQQRMLCNRILQKLTEEEKKFFFWIISRDPLESVYVPILIIYLATLICILMWPFNFDFPHEKNNAVWNQESNGIKFPSKGQVLSVSSSEAFHRGLLEGSGFSLEIWCATKSNKQTGPARIVSYSVNNGNRNFTLGQSGEKLIMRLRTTETDRNGIPQMEVDGVFDSLDLQHITVTYNFSEEIVYLNGNVKKRKKFPGGRFGNWDPSYSFILGNEATGDRPWRGIICYVAIYRRALTGEEIRENYLLGLTSRGGGPNMGSVASDDIVVRYLFEEGEGHRIGDDSSVPSMDLYIPDRIIKYERVYLSFDFRETMQNPTFYADLIINILIFIPLGFFLHAWLRICYPSSVKTLGFVLVIGALLAFCLESLQYLTPTRHSSLVDLLNNEFGVIVGILGDRLYEAHLKRQAKLMLSQGV